VIRAWSRLPEKNNTRLSTHAILGDYMLIAQSTFDSDSSRIYVENVDEDRSRAMYKKQTGSWANLSLFVTFLKSSGHSNAEI
jgi:hypothetical protein